MSLCERLGVSPKWPKVKGVFERASKFRTEFAQFDSDREGLRKYVTREDANPNHQPIPNATNRLPDFYAESIGQYQSQIVLLHALKQESWLQKLAELHQIYLLGIQATFFTHHNWWAKRTEPPRDGGYRMYSVHHAANMLAITAILGWKEAVIHQGYMNIAALNRGYQLELQYEDEHRRAQAFMLRLVCDWVGDVSHQWPSYAYDEPIYEALLAHWRTPNPEDLVPCLLAACDRHTWQTGRDGTGSNFTDFSTPAYMRVPIEILFLFRLREWQGLSNPTLDHPLMAAPFDKLPEAQPIPELDELMQAVLKRAREDWPHYDEVLSIEALKIST